MAPFDAIGVGHLAGSRLSKNQFAFLQLKNTAFPVRNHAVAY